MELSDLRHEAGVSSRRIAVGGLGVHTWVAGHGEPVVLVHGFGVSGRYMLPLAEELAPRFAVLTPELPGFGRSERPRAPLGIGGLADALGGCLDALELERPALVANSLGCQIVTELAVRRPDRVGPLMLIGPTIDPEQRLARRQLLRGLSETAREPLSLVALTARDGAEGAPGDGPLGARRPDRGAAAADRAAGPGRPRREGSVRQRALGRARHESPTPRRARRDPRRAARGQLHAAGPRRAPRRRAP